MFLFFFNGHHDQQLTVQLADCCGWDAETGATASLLLQRVQTTDAGGLFVRYERVGRESRRGGGGDGDGILPNLFSIVCVETLRVNQRAAPPHDRLSLFLVRLVPGGVPQTNEAATPRDLALF